MKNYNFDKRFDELIKKIQTYNKNADFKKIKKSWKVAKKSHGKQRRLSGEKYIAHPLSVAETLAHWRLDTTSIIAGILHDTIEDTSLTREDIVRDFGEEIALLVDGVTKVTSLRLRGSHKEEAVETLRKMILVMAQDLRVVLVKLADRLHNMETLDALPVESQKRNALETLQIYAPLAERLGIGEIKGRLEDLSFPYAYPKEYKKIIKLSDAYYQKTEDQIKEACEVLQKKLKNNNINAEIKGRKKHLFSLWNKLQRKEIDWDFNKILDIVALRILTNTEAECYGVLGVVHATYKPVPKIGISDFIAQPKPNGYQSIHTKVFGPGSKIVEIQIRTRKMHEQAEHGAASHWAYKEDCSINEKLKWVKELVRWQKEITDSEEFLQVVKFDALNHRNFVFSPKGDVYDLPQGATPVDFAFAVHTGLGRFIKCAKVNNKIVSLNHKLTSGDVVEIVRSKTEKIPNSDWLEFVATMSARREIGKKLRNKL